MIFIGYLLFISSLALGMYIGSRFEDQKLRTIIERKESEINHLRLIVQYLRESQCQCKKSEV